MTTHLRTIMLATIAWLLAACGESPDAYEVELTVSVPPGTPTVYVSGNLDELGPWVPDALPLGGNGEERSVAFDAPAGHELEYKFTLGSWDREALGDSGAALPNYQLLVDRDRSVAHAIAAFKEDPEVYMADWRGSGVLGTLVYWRDVESAFLGPSRNVEIWLPPGYDDDPERRYPVIYMHDGQELFDPRITYSGVDWGVDEAMMQGVQAGEFEPAIIVGVWNSAERFDEYSPWHNAPRYARFLIEELKPRVDREFRTLTGPEHTFAMGSSMGGLLSYYLVTNHPDVFGACGCVSSHFALSEKAIADFMGIDPDVADTTPYIVHDIENGATVPDGVRYYFDWGTETLDSTYEADHRPLRSWLLEQGLVEGEDFLMRGYEGHAHNEIAWRARVIDQLVWLLRDL